MPIFGATNRKYTAQRRFNTAKWESHPHESLIEAPGPFEGKRGGEFSGQSPRGSVLLVRKNAAPLPLLRAGPRPSHRSTKARKTAVATAYFSSSAFALP
jgi:hypothetical protein